MPASSCSRPRVLILAEAANPDWVSVPLVGWSMAQAIAKVADTHLVTQVRNRDAIARAGLREGTDFTAIDTEAIAGPIDRWSRRMAGGANRGWALRTALMSLSYPYFERCVWRQFAPALRAGAFDIVHRVTPVGPSVPSMMSWRVQALDVPFVLGPINGGVPWPKGFEAERKREGDRLSALRRFSRHLPSRRRTLQAASAILVGSGTAWRDIPAAHREKTIYLPENAIDPKKFDLVAPPPGDGPIRASFIGRLVPLKGVDMLISAAAPLLAAGRLHLDLIGDGPMRGALEAQAKAAGVDGQITFHGMVPHAEVQGLASRSQIFTFPSIREFGGGAVLEAMALGVVPIVMDYGGPGELVSERTGFKVPMGSREQIISDLRRCLEGIVANPACLVPKAKAARAHVTETLTWTAKSQQIRDIYDWILAGRPHPAPVFFPDVVLAD